jgi:hypothetical protein
VEISLDTIGVGLNSSPTNRKERVINEDYEIFLLQVKAMADKQPEAGTTMVSPWVFGYGEFYRAVATFSGVDGRYFLSTQFKKE